MSTSMAFEQIPASLGQRHQRRLLPTHDVGSNFDQTFLAEPSQLSLSGIRGTSSMVEEILRGHDSKGAYRGEDAYFRFTEIDRAVPVSNRPPGVATRQIEVAREHVPTVVGVGFRTIVSASRSTTEIGAFAFFRPGIDVTPHAGLPTPSSPDADPAIRRLAIQVVGPCGTAFGPYRAGTATVRCRSKRRRD